MSRIYTLRRSVPCRRGASAAAAGEGQAGDGALSRCLADDGGGTAVDAMDIDLIFKIAAIGIIVAVLNQLLVRSGREEQALMTTLAGLVVVLMILVREISSLFQLIKTLFQF